MKITLFLLTLASVISPFSALYSAVESRLIPGAAGNYGGLITIIHDHGVPALSRSFVRQRVIRHLPLPHETPLNSGTLTVQVSESGNFTAALNWKGYRYNFQGAINPSTLTFERDFPDRGQPGQKLELKLTLRPEARILHCDVTALGIGNVFYTAKGDLSGAAPDPTAGEAFAGTTNTSFIDPPAYGILKQEIAGDGFSITRISKKRGFFARIVGRLPDTEPFSAGSLLRGTDYTIFSGLYQKTGRFGGLTIGQLSAANLSSIQNVILWAKLAGADRIYYPKGFETGYEIKTDPYPIYPPNIRKPIPPISTTPGTVNGAILFSYGNIGQDSTGAQIVLKAQIQIGSFGAKVLSPNPQRITLRTNAAAATWNGTFIHPVSGKRTTFNGGFVEAKEDKNGEGRGNFQGSIANSGSGLIESGSVRILVD